MRYVTLIGARPQFIKHAIVSVYLRQVVDDVLVHTGQHYDETLSDIFFRELDIPVPTYSLHVGSGTHGAQTSEILRKTEEILQQVKPDGVIVYGDTNSTLAGALAAAKMHIPIAHIEAGLRSYNRRMPEELNRVVTDHLASLHFCPTEQAVANLRREGVLTGVHRVGDVMYDATLHFRERAKTQSTIIQKLSLNPQNYLLATVHRAENTDDFDLLYAVFQALHEVALRVPTVIPLHPRTSAALAKIPAWQKWRESFILPGPVGYLDMLMLEAQARWVATDSGGVQKEAFFCGVPCITLRQETEWTELIQLGWNRLLPPQELLHNSSALLQMLPALEPGLPDTHPYGMPGAASRIVERLTSLWTTRRRVAA